MKYPFATITNIIFNVVGWMTPALPFRIALNLLGIASAVFHYLEGTGHRLEWAFQKADVLSIYLLMLLITTHYLGVSDWFAVLATGIMGVLHITKGWFESFSTVLTLFGINTILTIAAGDSVLYILFFLAAGFFGHSGLTNIKYDIRHGLWHVLSGLGFYFWLVF